jgi:glyoxylase-like metal-dependent hydrolase (beta-lactamase superfamily II)
MTLDGTNTYIVQTATGHVVVDPGPLLPDHLQVVAGQGPVVCAVLTHHHADHSEGATRFSELTGAPVLARDVTLCRGGVLPDDGEILNVPSPMIRVIDTPGHTADSVCLIADDGSTRVLFSGDTIVGRGTAVVAHPDGNLADYLDSLERLRTVTDKSCILAPGHGPVRGNAAAAVTDYLAHRQDRLDQVRSALSAGAQTAHDVVEIVYSDVDRSLWPAAELTVEAALAYLRDEPRTD